MKKVRFTFYLAKFEWRNVFKKGKKLHVLDDAISWWTWLFNPGTPGYSHVVVWVPGKDGYFDFEAMERRHSDDDYETVDAGFLGICYTSTMRGDNNGTVSRPASEVFTNPKRWEYLEFEVTDESFEEAKADADAKVKKNIGYAMRTIARFFMPLPMLKWPLIRKLKLDDPEREICSEHGEGWATRLYKRNILIGTYLLHKILIRSPRRLWRDLVRRHGVATYSLATGAMVRDSKGKRV